MNIRQFWSNTGLFYSEHGHLTPRGLRTRITVSSHRTSWETAAMVEFASRIGLHMAELSTPIFDQLFIFDQLDPHSRDEEDPFHVVLGCDTKWLSQILGERIAPCLKALEVDHETGILYVDRNLLVVTGTSPEMTLHATRSLVSDHFLNQCQQEEGFLLISRSTYSIPLDSGLPSYDKKPSFSLHHLFTNEGIYQQKEGELFPTLDCTFDVRESDIGVTVASVELAARLAMGAGYVCFPTTCVNQEYHSQRFLISFETSGSDGFETKFELTSVAGTPSLQIHSASDQLIDTVREMIDEWFEHLDTIQRDTWRHRFAALKSDSHDIHTRAKLGMQAYADRNRGSAVQIVIPEHLAEPTQLWNHYLRKNTPERTVPITIKEEKPIWTACWEDPGELADIDAYVLETMAQIDETGSLPLEMDLEITTTISEKTFKTWAKQIQEQIHEKWRVRAVFIYRDANKSGFHWAMQEVVPQLKRQKEIHRIDIQARAFTPEKKHFDLVHRFLQELYPLDAILSAELQLPLERVHLNLLSDESAPMFSIVARDKQGEQLAAWSWEGWVQSLPYMPDQPGRGHVMVPFAGCRMYKNGEKKALACRTFETNPYRFWVWYQQYVLPHVISEIGQVPGIPKFSRLECHVDMDAADVLVPHLEEISSVLEALHEDIYFYTLHYLHQHGKQTGDSGWDAPGGILPFMHEAPGGKPCAHIELYALPTDHEIKLMLSNGEEKVIKPIAQDLMKPLTITSLVRKKDNSLFSFSGGVMPELEMSCSEWLGASFAISSPNDEAASEATDDKSLIHDVFVNEDVQRWLEIRKDQIFGQVTPVDFSLAGRWIWLVELYAKGNDGKMVSCNQKHSLYKPTFFLNARHHANEVSSTNSALALIEQVIKDPSLLEKINIVVVPLENVDGSDIHDQMAKEHPCWKLHAARYNACGVEFAKYRFQKNVPFGESRVYPKVWDRWAPDIVLDDHGVPSHEWIQPFSGYHSPPRFPVSYWIPSARMYTIWRERTDGSEAARMAYLSLRSAITERLDRDDAVAYDNKAWLNTYTRWGHAFDEKHFPIELSNGSIAYTRHCETNPHSHDLIERFGDWVTADLMTEVNDETVYGKELAACKHAHQVVYEAILDWMAKRVVQVQVIRDRQENGSTRIGLERTRPL